MQDMALLRAEHEADVRAVTRALGEYQKGTANLSDDLKEVVHQQRRLALLTALNEIATPALARLRARKDEMAALREQLRDPEFAAVLAMSGRAGDVAPSDLLAAGLVPGLSDMALLELAAHVGPGVFLAIRAELVKRHQASVATSAAGGAALGQARDTSQPLAEVNGLAQRFVNRPAIAGLAQAERTGLEMELAYLNAVNPEGAPAHKLTIGRELAALPAVE